jgi:hypothetical protein
MDALRISDFGFAFGFRVSGFGFPGLRLHRLAHEQRPPSLTSGPGRAALWPFGHWRVGRADQLGQQPLLLLKGHEDLRGDWRCVPGGYSCGVASRQVYPEDHQPGCR